MDKVLKCNGYNAYDINIIRGQGDCLYDDQNRKYVDFEAGVWSTALGHSHLQINLAMKMQIDQIIHLGYHYKSPIVEEAAAKVLETVHIPDGKCIFLSSGSESVEFGVQSIRRITQQPLLLSLTGSYLAAYGSAGRRSLEEWYFFDWSQCKDCDLDQCSSKCCNFKEIPFERIGGLVFEPGNTSGQVKLPPKKLIKNLENTVRQNNGLIMANEVTTGFGRAGAWFGYEHYNLQPDIIAMGKSMGNGYPVSAVAMRADIADSLESSGFRYAQSHQNDALGCAVAIEVIKVIKKEDLIIRSAELGGKFKAKLEQLTKKHDCIKEVRGRGLMRAIEFKEDTHFSLLSVHRKLFEEGFLVGYNTAGNLLRFYPALIIQERSIENMVEGLNYILGQ
ncbi:MAG TPA: aspartate aminotransferase family protein [Candidatus Nitrosocosmicus sp.]|nr:aspartate aminotransferase family protein [Candidatus Nitrosocosmicus sp.]